MTMSLRMGRDTAPLALPAPAGYADGPKVGRSLRFAMIAIGLFVLAFNYACANPAT